MKKLAPLIELVLCIAALQVTALDGAITLPGTTERVSVSAEGEEGNGQSLEPSISNDGRYVAFYSEADNLVPGDWNTDGDVFIYDRQTATVERITSWGGRRKPAHFCQWSLRRFRFCGQQFSGWRYKRLD